jgi:integrase
VLVSEKEKRSPTQLNFKHFRNKKLSMSSDLIDPNKPIVERLVRINGISFEENFVARLIAQHLARNKGERTYRITDAYNIYIKECPASLNRRFVVDTTRNVTNFLNLFGDLELEELKHWHIAAFRDHLLHRGLHPASVRKQCSCLNAMLNVAFRHLDIDRLSPFRGLTILGEDKPSRVMPVITDDLIRGVKEHLLSRRSIHCLVALLQLNTGVRLSEPVFARLEDCVLDHNIPHLWIRQTQLSNRKTRSSIRAVPLYGVSLDAAKALHAIATRKKSSWFIPAYARDNGNTSCSAIINKTLKKFEFRSHMFRHALIDRMKACNDIPTRLAESITGHSSGGSHFNFYGTVGYTLEQKLAVIKKISI